jgi:hypothetical protein
MGLSSFHDRGADQLPGNHVVPRRHALHRDAGTEVIASRAVPTLDIARVLRRHRRSPLTPTPARMSSRKPDIHGCVQVIMMLSSVTLKGVAELPLLNHTQKRPSVYELSVPLDMLMGSPGFARSKMAVVCSDPASV